MNHVIYMIPWFHFHYFSVFTIEWVLAIGEILSEYPMLMLLFSKIFSCKANSLFILLNIKGPKKQNALINTSKPRNIKTVTKTYVKSKVSDISIFYN